MPQCDVHLCFVYLPICLALVCFNLFLSASGGSCLRQEGFNPQLLLSIDFSTDAVLHEMSGPSSLVRTPLTIARKVIHKFVGHLERQATELIWKPRCKTTVEREKERGITTRYKESKYTGPRGQWSNGYEYICEDKHCPCGGRLEDHEGGIYPGATLDTRRRSYVTTEPAGKEARGYHGEESVLMSLTQAMR
ncbi:hypothetical protein EDD21DRAFT_351260 [Dissophora ornata]|nr:hypothetical protein EDD21DRAFT_351260 [Dissophora ornata]